MQNLENGWFSFDLGKYRPINDYSTYVCFSYDELPPLPDIEFNGSFGWLSTENPEPIEDEEQLLEIVEEAKNAGIELPKSFLTFMGDSNLRSEVGMVSCTACYFELTHGLIPVPNAPGEYIIHFLSDQQYCLLWYLYIKDGKEAGVLVSPYFFEKDGYIEGSNGQGKIAENTVLYCATEFERFIYRFWLENVLWEKVSGSNGELNAIEKAYTDHYLQLQK